MIKLYQLLLHLVEEWRRELGDNNRIGEGDRFFDDVIKIGRIEEYNMRADKQQVGKIL